MQPSNRTVRKPHRLPVTDYCQTDCVYFFTICARHHINPFLKIELAKTVVDSILWTRTRYAWELYAYCLMPDHFHVVCRLSRDSKRLVNAGVRGLIPESVLDHVARFKSFTTTQSWKHGMSGPLWQSSSYDEVLDDPRAVQEVVNYVLENPVRKGLVEEWTNWPYSQAVDAF